MFRPPRAWSRGARVKQRLDLHGANLCEARFTHANLAESDLHDARLGRRT
jgi:uncharacterized protein YjbI with pentapeptide repeats